MDYLKEEFKKAEYDYETNKNFKCYESLYFTSSRKKHDSGYYFINVYGERNNKIYRVSIGSDVLDFYKTKDEMYGFSIDIPEPSVFRIFYHLGYIVVPSNGSNFLIHGIKGEMK